MIDATIYSTKITAYLLGFMPKAEFWVVIAIIAIIGIAYLLRYAGLLMIAIVIGIIALISSYLSGIFRPL